MKCPVCNGTGVHSPPRIPSETGGWLNEKYIFASECGACNGSGYVDDNDSSAIEDSDFKSEKGDSEPGVDLAQLIALQDEILLSLQESVLPSELKDRWFMAVKSIIFAFPSNTIPVMLDAIYKEVQEASEQASRFVSHLEPGKLDLVETDLTLIANALARLKYHYAHYLANREG